MSKSNNYIGLGNQVSGALDGNNQPGVPVLADYKHAARLYLDNYQSHSPKYGFLYYVNFIINPEAVVGGVDKNVGVLVKKIDLPKFSITHELINQYNRKTQVTTKLSYNPVVIDFHDDNSGITNELWASYYKNLFADGNYDTERTNNPVQFGDTKFGTTDYEYGMYNRGVGKAFFERIDIYILQHTRQDHTLISLINPKISEWRHDTLNQSEGGRVLQNSMTVVYENVLYYSGSRNDKIDGFVNEFYDTTPSPLKIGGNSKNDPIFNQNVDLRPSNAVIFDRATAPRQTGNPLFDKQGKARTYNIPPKQVSLFDRAGKPKQYGLVNPPNNLNNPLLDIAAILAKNYINKNGLGRVGPRGYNITSSAVNYAIRSPAGKYYEPPSTQYQPGIFQLPGGVGINVFKAYNKGVDGKVRVNPASIIFPPKR